MVAFIVQPRWLQHAFLLSLKHRNKKLRIVEIYQILHTVSGSRSKVSFISWHSSASPWVAAVKYAKDPLRRVQIKKISLNGSNYLPLHWQNNQVSHYSPRNAITNILILQTGLSLTIYPVIFPGTLKTSFHPENWL